MSNISISLTTALEIYSNPSDLFLSFSKPTLENKFGVVITRGPGHDFKPLISSNFYLTSDDQGILDMQRLLEACRNGSITALTTKTNPIGQILNPDNLPADKLCGMSEEQIQRILSELREHRQASTYVLFAKPS